MKLSSSSPIPALYFLLCEMHIVAALHLDALTLFYNIWSNADITAHEILKYMLRMSDSQSMTWAAHIRVLCLQYYLPDPLLIEQQDASPKSEWKNWCKTKARAYHEKIIQPLLE